MKSKYKPMIWIGIITVLLIFLLVFLVIENIKLNVSYGSKLLMPLIYVDIVAIVILIILAIVKKKKLKRF